MANVIITSNSGVLEINFNDKSSFYGYDVIDIPSNFTTLLIPNGSNVVILAVGDLPPIKLKPSDVDLPVNNGTAIDLRNKIKSL